jgi:lysophospholipase L1-like esterase
VLKGNANCRLFGSPKSRIRRLISGIAIAIALTGALEIALRIFSPLAHQWRAMPSTLKNRFAEGETSLHVSPYVQAQLAEMVRTNLEGNALLVPSPRTIFRGAPNPAGKELFCHDSVNELGFRGIPFDRVRARFHVVLVGDSCGFGFWICRYENSFARLLEKELQRKGFDAALLNLSQAGFSSTQARILFEDWGKRLRPDLVIFYLGWNDLWPTPRFSDSETIRYASFTQAFPFSVLMDTEIYRHLEFAYLAALPRPVPQARQLRRVEDAETIANFRAMLGESRGLGAASILLLPPFSEGAPKLSLFAPPFQELLRHTFSGSEGVSILDLQREMNRPGSEQFFQDGVHPNEAGQVTIAAALAALAVRSLGARR